MAPLFSGSSWLIGSSICGSSRASNCEIFLSEKPSTKESMFSWLKPPRKSTRPRSLSLPMLVLILCSNVLPYACCLVAPCRHALSSSAPAVEPQRDQLLANMRRRRVKNDQPNRLCRRGFRHSVFWDVPQDIPHKARNKASIGDCWSPWVWCDRTKNLLTTAFLAWTFAGLSRTMSHTVLSMHRRPCCGALGGRQVDVVLQDDGPG